MAVSITHIALNVPDLQLAETHYQQVFDMKVVTRESRMADGLWYGMPPDRNWDDAEAAGIEIHMLALRRDDFLLALFPGNPEPGQVFEIGIGVPAEEIAAIRRRLPTTTNLLEDEFAPNDLLFEDQFGFKWHIYSEDEEFLGVGDALGRWLDL